MRETPPAALMSAGMRSSAITAHAPAASAIFACSGVVTSMITPPLSICARFLFNSCLSLMSFLSIAERRSVSALARVKVYHNAIVMNIRNSTRLTIGKTYARNYSVAKSI